MLIKVIYEGESSMKWMREEERKFFGEHGYLIESVAEYTRHGNVFREEEHWFIPKHDKEHIITFVCFIFYT